jgi:hypothetical protein
MLTSELHYAVRAASKRERIKYISKSGSMSYNKFAQVPLISVGETNISRSEAIIFHKVAYVTPKQ